MNVRVRRPVTPLLIDRKRVASSKRINWEYLNLYQEIPLFCGLKLLKRRKAVDAEGVLIVSTCLVGEFVASLPALHDYLGSHPGIPVDLMVSPPLQSLASRVRGVRKVFTARSLYHRSSEKQAAVQDPIGAYREILVLRISVDAYRIIRRIPSEFVHTALKPYALYAAHLVHSLLRHRTPKQWREINFAMLGGMGPREVPFEEIFDLREADSKFLETRPTASSDGRCIVVHTGSNWPMKRWPNDRWAELLRRLRASGSYEFVFVGTRDEDEQNYLDIASKLDFEAHTLIGRTSLLELMLILKACDAFIGVDSGPMNMARIAGTPSLILYGPGPHMYLPSNPRDIAIDKSRGGGVVQMFLARRHGLIHQITVDEVFEGFHNLMARP